MFDDASCVVFVAPLKASPLALPCRSWQGFTLKPLLGIGAAPASPELQGGACVSGLTCSLRTCPQPWDLGRHVCHQQLPAVLPLLQKRQAAVLVGLVVQDALKSCCRWGFLISLFSLGASARVMGLAPWQAGAAHSGRFVPCLPNPPPQLNSWSVSLPKVFAF